MANENDSTLGRQLGIGVLVAGVASLGVGWALSRRPGAAQADNGAPQEPSPEPAAPEPAGPAVGTRENPAVRVRGGNL